MTISSQTADVAAFFDMDKTLLSDSSVLLLARYMRSRGELSWSEVRIILKDVLRYKLGQLDLPEATRRYVEKIAGHLEADRIAHSHQWFQDHLIHYVAAEGRRWIEEHRRNGHRVALITASPTYTADQLARHLSIEPEDVMATRFEVEDGRFTGRVLEPMVYGQGKLQAARAYAARFGVDLARSYFYTDSIEDLPLLERIGNPVAVNPDRPLRKLAKARGWAIQRFY
ncbi:MAG: HAD family hydrolase [Caldilineales bacterium]